VHPLIANKIVGHGDHKKTFRSLYLSISDADLNTIDRMRFDEGETEIFAKISDSKGKTASKASPKTEKTNVQPEFAFPIPMNVIKEIPESVAHQVQKGTGLGDTLFLRAAVLGLSSDQQHCTEVPTTY
jgi:hypothetical protein